MSKTAEKIHKAWQEGKTLKVNNTKTDGVSIYLFGNEIVKRQNRMIYIRTAGYPTKTTKDRLNSLDNVHVYSKNGVVYLNGKVWSEHENWIKVL
jgi:hypothetical protein